jgi:hypothetical protein
MLNFMTFKKQNLQRLIVLFLIRKKKDVGIQVFRKFRKYEMHQKVKQRKII